MFIFVELPDFMELSACDVYLYAILGLCCRGGNIAYIIGKSGEPSRSSFKKYSYSLGEVL